jgi:DNA-directed RNA polymerase specialized sigma24 family protein
MREIDCGRSIGRHLVEAEHFAMRDIGGEDSYLAALRTGDRQTFEQLCRECYPYVAHFLSLVIPEAPTEDACIDAFTAAWRHVAEVPRKIAALTWIFSIVYKQTHERAHVREAESHLYVNNRSSANRAEVPQIPRRSDPRDVLRELAWEPRVIAVLVYGMSFSMNTICRITGMTDREVTAHLDRARHRFRLRERPVCSSSHTLDSTAELSLQEQKTAEI